MMKVIGFVVAVLFTVVHCETDKKPHILFIMADDLGWNDVGWHNNKVKTPNLDALAHSGIILNQSYVHKVCSPSRGSLMTGNYPYHIGLQNGVIRPLFPAGIPLRFKFLPERLKSLGYATHAVGKWHLGFCSWKYTPLERGFDSFLGYYTGAENYFSHMSHGMGFDFRNNTDVLKTKNNTYSAEVFGQESVDIISKANPEKPMFLYLPFQSVHGPLQVPKKYENMYKNVQNKKRRVYLGMVTAMDEAVGNIVKALKQRGMYNNTLIIFTADNGGQVMTGGNNWPLRGNKGNLYEGGNRGAAFVHGTMLKNQGTTNNGLMHISDWYPTLLSAAQDKNIPTDIDGVDHWDMLSNNAISKRKEMVYNILYSESTNSLESAALRIGNFKLVKGDPGGHGGWYPEPNGNRNSMYRNKKKHKPKPSVNVTELYDLGSDPLEKNNVKDKYPKILQQLEDRLAELSKSRVPHLPRWDDPAGKPKNFGGAFSPGWCKPIN